MLTDRPQQTSPTVPRPWMGWLVLAAMTAVQTTSTFGALTLASIAPEVARGLEVAPSLIGYQISLAYGGGIITSLIVGSLIPRWGACRTTQCSLLLVGSGCVLCAVPHIASVAAGSLVMGLGYGLTNPSASHLLMRFGDKRRRNLIFAIKQSGVPLGGVLAGLIAPPIALTFGWQWAPLTVSAVSISLVAALQIARRTWDDDRQPDALVRDNPLAGVALIWSLRPLRWVSITAFCFSVVQLCLVTFLVTLLVEEQDFTLLEAGVMLSLVQVAGVGGRIAWAWLADRVHAGLVVFAALGLIMAAAALTTTVLSPASPRLVIQALFVLFGFTAVGWNGIYFGEIARLSPPGRIGAATGGSLVMAFTGVLVGPSLFSMAHAAIGSYGTTFGLLGVAAVAGAASAVLARRG